MQWNFGMARFIVAYFTLALAAAFCLPVAGQPPPHCAQILFCQFNQEATASGPEGIQKYSEDLIGLIIPPGSGNLNLEPIANRLARAEQSARTSRGKPVPEANIARAFNELMKAAGAPPTIKADESSIRSFRAHAASIKAFPALFSADRNGTNCDPGEAMFLLSLLISDNGLLFDRNLDTAQELMRPDNNELGRGGGLVGMERSPDSRRLLTLYSSDHSRSATIALFSQVLDILGL